MNRAADGSITDTDRSNIAFAVEQSARRGERIINTVTYIADGDFVVLESAPFSLTIQRETIAELKDLSADDLSRLTTSPSGSTIMVEHLDIYIETASLIADCIENLRARGHPFLQLMSGH